MTYLNLRNINYKFQNTNLKTCYKNQYRPKQEYYKHPITRSTNWNCFLLDLLDERETL